MVEQLPCKEKVVSSIPTMGTEKKEVSSSMSGPLIIITGLIYIYVAIEQAVKGNVPMAVTYGAYAVANYGLYLALK